MKYFVMPSDFKKETIDKYLKLNEKYPDSKVIETYGQITIGNKIGSGRAYNLIPQIDLKELSDFINYSAERGIGFNYTLNSTCLSNQEFSDEGAREIVSFLKDLYNAGVRDLTVAMPSLIELIKLNDIDFKIKTSTLCSVDNANKAMSYLKMGVDRIVVKEAINKDFNKLQSIVDVSGDKVEVIVNAICNKYCIYRTFHYNQTSHDCGDSDPKGGYYSHRCIMKVLESPENILKMCWIRPEDLKYYTSIGIHYFKIQGRQAVKNGDALRTLEVYMQERFDGNLLKLLDMFMPNNSFLPYIDNRKLDGFVDVYYKNRDFCKNECTKCHYCNSYMKKNFDYDAIQAKFKSGYKFYKQYDKFINMSNIIKNENKASSKLLLNDIL